MRAKKGTPSEYYAQKSSFEQQQETELNNNGGLEGGIEQQSNWNKKGRGPSSNCDAWEELQRCLEVTDQWRMAIFNEKFKFGNWKNVCYSRKPL